MTRTIAALVAAAVATALIFGPGRALLAGSSLRAEIPNGGIAQTTDPHAGHEQVASVAPAVAPAAAKPGPSAARVAFTAAPATRLEKGYVLSVRLTGPDARPVNETGVTFYEIVD